MALPPTAKAFTQAMDPADVVDFQLTLSQGDAATDLLQTGESVASFGLAVTAEAAAAGLTILDAQERQPKLVGLILRFWLAVDAAQWSAAAFSGAGASLGLELTIQTSSAPPRTKQRTVVVKVVQQ